MADQEEDFSSLSLPERFAHKVRLFVCLQCSQGAALNLYRTGKCEKQVTKMLQRHLEARLTNRTRPSRLFY